MGSVILRCPGAELPAGVVHEVQSQNHWLSKALTLLKHGSTAKRGFWGTCERATCRLFCG